MNDWLEEENQALRDLYREERDRRIELEAQARRMRAAQRASLIDREIFEEMDSRTTPRTQPHNHT